MVAAGHYADAPVLSIRLVRWWGGATAAAPRTSEVVFPHRGEGRLAPEWTRRGQPPTIGSTCQPLGLVSFPQFG